MTTVSQLAQTLQTVFTTTADAAARATGFCATPLGTGARRPPPATRRSATGQRSAQDRQLSRCDGAVDPLVNPHLCAG
jgi:hypothetical protein